MPLTPVGRVYKTFPSFMAERVTQHVRKRTESYRKPSEDDTSMYCTVFLCDTLNFSWQSLCVWTKYTGPHGQLCCQVVSALDLSTNGSRSKWGLGLCSKVCFNHITHFPLFTTWLNMTTDVKRVIKPQSSINPTVPWVWELRKVSWIYGNVSSSQKN